MLDLNQYAIQISRIFGAPIERMTFSICSPMIAP
jgi:hypothetical protein